MISEQKWFEKIIESVSKMKTKINEKLRQIEYKQIEWMRKQLNLNKTKEIQLAVN